jgi:hypothetical protein
MLIPQEIFSVFSFHLCRHLSAFCNYSSRRDLRWLSTRSFRLRLFFFSSLQTGKERKKKETKGSRWRIREGGKHKDIGQKKKESLLGAWMGWVARELMQQSGNPDGIPNKQYLWRTWRSLFFVSQHSTRMDRPLLERLNQFQPDDWAQRNWTVAYYSSACRQISIEDESNIDETVRTRMRTCRCLIRAELSRSTG